MKETATCKICGGKAKEEFRIPKSKIAGGPIPDSGEECIYFECTNCSFCFTTVHDALHQEVLYDSGYWSQTDPDWFGRALETMRLVLLANALRQADPWSAEILDYGCGMGAFVQSAREKLNMHVWGHDIIAPKYGKEHFHAELPRSTFDIIVACEVIEHLPFPLQILQKAFEALKPGGVFAFQTAYYDPSVCDRNWWYVGPANGHISLYSVRSLDVLFREFGGIRRMMWNEYPGVQAWQIR